MPCLALIETAIFRAKHGMVASAIIFKNSHHTDMLQMQFSRIYQHANVKNHCFSNENTAKKWLQQYLKEMQVS
jgi:hypothetical protein